MITEEQLDTVIDDLEQQGADLVQFYQASGQDLPVLTSFLTDTDTELLTDDEHDYLLYLGMIMIRLYQSAGQLQDDLDQDTLGENEEQLWQLVNDLSPRPLDKIWERTDSNAVVTNFLLESLTIDAESEFLTETGAQLMYVKLASIAGAILASQN